MFESRWYRAFSWLLVGAYMALIWRLSSRPTVPLPMWFTGQDKVYHLVGYSVLGFLVAHATGKGSYKTRFWIALVVASLYGVSDEIHQSFVPGRDASAGDWLADTFGAWLGAYLYLRGKTVLRHFRNPRAR